MKYWRSIIEKVILLLSALLLLSSCATSQLQPEGERRTVDMGSYAVDVPSGGDWQIEIDREKGVVICQKLKKWWTGRVLGSTLIQTFRNEVAPQGWHLSEEEVADDYRNNEERNMREEGVKKGLYELTDVEKSIETVDDKKLYAMHYKMKMELSGGVWEHGLAARRAQEAVLYLYFPPDFKDKHTFYGFLISEDYERGSFVTKDLDQIYPIINSFQLKNK